MGKSTLRRQIRGASLGLEDYEGGEGAPAVVTETPEHETVAAQVLAVNEADTEVDQLEEGRDQLEDAAASLESLIVSIEEIVESGNMTPAVAQVMNHAVDNILEPVEVTSEEVLPSLESYGASADRRETGKISVESLKEVLANIWQKIKDFINKIRKQMKDYYLRVWDAAPRLKAKAEALRARAQDVTGSPKKDKVDIGGLAAKLQVGKTIPSASEAMSALKGVAEKLFGEGYPQAALAYAGSVTSAVGGLDFAADDKFEGSAEALLKLTPVKVPGLADGAVDSGDKRFADVGEGLKATKSATLPGNQAIFYIQSSVTPVDVKGLREYLERGLAKTSYVLAPADAKKAEKAESTEVSVLSRSDVVGFCEAVAEVAAMIEKYKRGYEQADKAKEEAVKAGDKASAAAKKSKDLSAGNQAISTASLRLLQNAATVIDQPTQKFTSYVISTAHAMLSLCEKSLAQY